MADKSRGILVVNADDFGYSEPRNKGIVEAFISGLVSNVSLLVNGVSSKEAVELAKKYDIPMGLHLNLTEGLPAGSKHESLVGSDGFFLGKFGFRKAVSSATVNMDEVSSHFSISDEIHVLQCSVLLLVVVHFVGEGVVSVHVVINVLISIYWNHEIWP